MTFRGSRLTQPLYLRLTPAVQTISTVDFPNRLNKSAAFRFQLIFLWHPTRFMSVCIEKDPIMRTENEWQIGKPSYLIHGRWQLILWPKKSKERKKRKTFRESKIKKIMIKYFCGYERKAKSCIKIYLTLHWKKRYCKIQ